MRCYLVTFHSINGCGTVDFIQSFYAEDTVELAEAVLEYEEDLEDTLDAIIVSKTIKEVHCKGE